MQKIFKDEFNFEITIHPGTPIGENKSLPKAGEQDGCYDCEYCGRSGKLKLSSSYSVLEFKCPICKGRGRYDWVTNVMKKARWSEFERLGGTLKIWRNQDMS